jgi:hypothetical protein
MPSLIIASQLNHTALLLEEPEVHQHSAALCKIAHENELQLFITTHSLDVISCLAQVDGAAIFHLELDAAGELTAPKVRDADARILTDLGVDLRLPANYLILEGDLDRVFWETACSKLSGKSLRDLSYQVVQATKDQQKEAIAALAWLGGTIKVLRDYDRDQDSTEMSKSLGNSLGGRFKDCKPDGESISIGETGAKIIIIPQGLPSDNDLASVGIKSHSMEDYCLKLLVSDSQVQAWADISLKELAKDAENALKNIRGPKLDSSKLLLGALALKKGLDDKEIIREIVGMSTSKALHESLGNSCEAILGTL